MIKRIIFFAIACQSLGSLAQTFNSSPNLPIVDNATTEYILNVNGLIPTQLDTLNFGLETVCINLTHSWDADLDIFIVAPDGTIATLTAALGGSDDNYTNTCFNQNALNSITQGSAPFTGTFKPLGQLGIINNNQNPNGQWKLRITDTYPSDAGDILDWSITFGVNPASYFSISSSDLPIFVINTNGQTIPDEPRIAADLGVIWHLDTARNYLTDPFNHYNLKVGIETRGASSSNFPKKSYRIELWDQNNQDVDSALCGFAADNDWVLSAQYTDKTLMRGMLTFDLIRRMGWWAPHVKPVELILNGEYKGIYLLMEKVKRDNDRVDIAKLDSTELSGDDLTGGYILKLDKNSGQSNPGWTSPYAPWPSGSPIEINYEYPAADEIMLEQINYIQAYVDSFEDALAGPNFADPIVGYRKYVDINSCVDAFIISEFSKSMDAYRKSFFMYKDKNSNGGKLVMAPIWDYDISFGNVNYCNGQFYSGWQYNFNYVCGNDFWLNPFWFERMTQDPAFNDQVVCRWNELRQNVLSNQRIGTWIDSTAQVLNESQDWNYTVWPIIGNYVWPNYYIGQSYQEEVDTLKWWIDKRGIFLQNSLMGNPANCSPVNLSQNNDLEELNLFPNPFTNQLQAQIYCKEDDMIEIKLTDLLGNLLLYKKVLSQLGINQIEIYNGSELSAGVYQLQFITKHKQWNRKVIAKGNE
jgi:subtilisin-like proprotein convertase family protein